MGGLELFLVWVFGPTLCTVVLACVLSVVDAFFGGRMLRAVKRWTGSTHW